jgi:hypothetical protein
MEDRKRKGNENDRLNRRKKQKNEATKDRPAEEVTTKSSDNEVSSTSQSPKQRKNVKATVVPRKPCLHPVGSNALEVHPLPSKCRYNPARDVKIPAWSKDTKTPTPLSDEVKQHRKHLNHLRTRIVSLIL